MNRGPTPERDLISNRNAPGLPGAAVLLVVATSLTAGLVLRSAVGSGDMAEPEGRGSGTVYQIRIRGQLGAQWTEWFEGLAVTLTDGDTLLTGVVDQAALHGLLRKVRDLGMSLVSVTPVGPDESA
jgi:hypothetical protein